MEKMLRAVNCVNMWPISPLSALKHLHPSFSRTLHGHVRQPENWSWNLLIMKTSSGFMTWYTDPGMGSGIWNESVSTIPHTESQNHPCRLATKTNKTRWTIPGVSCSEETPDSKKRKHARMGNGMQMMFLWLSFHFEHYDSRRERGREGCRRKEGERVEEIHIEV